MMTTRIKHLYIHVPFCNSICYYCDFCRVHYSDSTVEKWLCQIEKEICNKCANNYETVYIGGGTPSCLKPDQLDRLLSCIDKYCDCSMEYTVEANPESLDTTKIQILKKHHVNRVSLGVQTTDEGLLKVINRKHSFNDVRNVITNLRNNGIENISVDLMYSLPTQTLDILDNTIKDILELDVPHISIYSLTIEENSVFGKKNIDKLPDDLEADMYEMIVQKLTDAGYINYEVSNFAKKGFDSKHNLGYWNYDNFLGISAGAAGKIDDCRYQITSNINRYLVDYNDFDEKIHLSKKDMMFENIMMSLRTTYGLDIEDFNKKYDCDFKETYPIALSNPLLKIENNRAYCTNLGLLNSLLLDFME